MKSEIKQLHDEVRMMREDIKEIKQMLVPEVTATKAELKSVQEGRKEFSRGEFREWKEVRKRAVS